MVSTAVRSFVEVPLSQTVPEGVEVQFRCRHRTTNTLVWEVDGVLFNQSSTLNASTFAVPVDDGMARHFLLFDAILSYHHTSIVCAAIFSNGCPQQKTMPALLLIQGIEILSQYVCMAMLSYVLCSKYNPTLTMYRKVSAQKTCTHNHML
jgi:hypothetical protein